jgi:oxygen-independent coproporphyrinogen-3 oxidase
MYGLPHQDSWTVAETLKKVIDLGPDSIACRGYSHMPNVFSAHFGIDENALPNAAQSLDLLKLIHQTLSSAGYINVGIDHFVLAKESSAEKPGSQANHTEAEYNTPYDLLGLGVSAISHIGGYIVQNESTLKRYYQRTQLSELPIERGLKLSEEDKIRRFIILSFATQRRLDFEQLSIHFGINFREKFASELALLHGMRDIGLLHIDDQQIAITPSGRPFTRTVCTYFDSYLDSRLIARLARGDTQVNDATLSR